MEQNIVTVLIKDQEFIPDIVSIGWNKQSEIFVMFQNEDDTEYYLHCRENPIFPISKLGVGKCLTIPFRNASRFEVASKENGFMKVIIMLLYF